MKISTSVTKAIAVLGVPFGLVMYGCGDSDGEAGTNGAVRFSQVLDYGETNDFSAPIAAGRPLFVALQHPKEGFVDDETYAELTLRVEAEDGSELDAVWPFGFAQYGLRIEEPGRYWLLAQEDGRTVDALPVDVEAVDHITLSDRVQLKTTKEDDMESCSRIEELDGLDGLTLHPNQRLEIFVVPRTPDDRAMLGLLALTARTESVIQLDAPLFGQGRRANALSLSPQGSLPATVNLSITDEDSGQTLSFSFAGATEDAEIDCN